MVLWSLKQIMRQNRGQEMWRKAVYLINTMNSFKYLNTFQDMWMFEAGDDHIHIHTHTHIYIYNVYIYKII